MKRIFNNSAVKRSLLKPTQQLRFISKDANRGVTSATSMNTNAPPFTKSDQELKTSPPPSSPFGRTGTEPITDTKQSGDKFGSSNVTPTKNSSSSEIFEKHANPIGGMGHGVAASNQAAETNQPFSTDPAVSTTATNWNPTEKKAGSTNYGAFEQQDKSTSSSKSGGSSPYAGQQDFDKKSGKSAGFQDQNLDKKMPDTPITSQFQSNDAPFSDAKQAFNKYPAGSKPEVTNDSNRSTFKNEGKADQLNKGQQGSSFGDKSSSGSFSQSKSGSGSSSGFDNQMNRNFYDKSSSRTNQFADRNSGSGSGNFSDKLSGKGNVVNEQSGKFSNDTTLNMGDKSNFQKANNSGDKQFDNLDMASDLKSGKSDNSGFMNEKKKM